MNWRFAVVLIWFSVQWRKWRAWKLRHYSEFYNEIKLIILFGCGSLQVNSSFDVLILSTKTKIEIFLCIFFSVAENFIIRFIFLCLILRSLGTVVYYIFSRSYFFFCAFLRSVVLLVDVFLSFAVSFLFRHFLCFCLPRTHSCIPKHARKHERIAAQTAHTHSIAATT